MDKTSEFILETMIQKGSECVLLPKNSPVSFDDPSYPHVYADEIAEHLGIDERAVILAAKYLAEHDYLVSVSCVYRLTHMGLNWRYFEKQERCAYWSDKAFDIVAACISFLALIVSIVSIFH